MTAHEMVAKARNLPQVPGAALRLVGLLDASSDNKEVIEVIKSDALLTAKLLRVCNSSALGLAEPASSVDHAILLLGPSQVMSLVLSLAFGKAMTSQPPSAAMESDKLWMHSFMAATAAEIIVNRGFYSGRLLLGSRFFRRSAGLRFCIRLQFGGLCVFLDALCDEVFLGKLSDLAMKLDLVAGDFSGVFDFDFVVVEFQGFHKGDLVLIDFSVDDLHLVCSRFPFTDGFSGELVSFHLEFEDIFLDSDLAVELSLPFAGDGLVGGAGWSE